MSDGRRDDPQNRLSTSTSDEEGRCQISSMGRAVQLGLDKSAVVRLLRVAIEVLNRAEQLGSYSAATAVIAACLRLVNAAAMAGSALSNGISAKQRSWKRTSC